MADTSALSARIKDFAALSTQREREILTWLRTTSEPVTVILPDGTDTQRLEEILYVAAGGYSTAKDLISRVKPVIGRACLIVRENPQIALNLGYRNFDHWMTSGVPLRYCISRAEAFNCLSIAEHLPDIPSDVMQELGIGKLFVTAQAVKRDTAKGEPREVVARKREFWLEEAKKSKTVQALVRVIEEHNVIDVGALSHREVIAIQANPETKKRWETFASDPDVREHCFGAQPNDAVVDEGAILDHMMSEVSLEWKAQVGDAQRARITGQVQAG